MGMGYGANFADTVSEDFIKEQCPKEFESFLEALQKNNEEEDIQMLKEEFAYNIRYMSQVHDEVIMFFENLCKTFKSKTGLELGVLYHNSTDFGCRYDDVDGIVWCVENAYELSEAGKKNESKIERKFWVTFG